MNQVTKVPYEDEIVNYLRSIFKTSWMNEDDLQEGVQLLLDNMGETLQSLSDKIQIGVNNGMPVEKQFELVKEILAKTKS